MMCHSFPSESEHTCIPIQSRSDPLPDGTLRWNNEENDEKSFFHSVGCPLAQRSVHKDWTFMEMEQCTQPCAPMHHDDHETFIIRLVVGLFASLTAVVSAFGIYIFMSETKRYVIRLFFAFLVSKISQNVTNN